MNSLEEFMAKNYREDEKICHMKFTDGSVHNEICTATSWPMASGEDIYMSMNPISARNKRIRRDKEHVSRLKWLYVDLDFYHSSYKDFSKQQIVGLLELDYFGKSIPTPTYIIDSGRGIYMLWSIDEHTKAYPRWEKMQKYLCNQLAEYGADYKVAADSARVLRRIGSINSKSGTEVKIISFTENKYSLTNLLREYVIPQEPSKKMTEYAKNISKILEIPIPDLRNRDEVKQYIKRNKEAANLFYRIQRVTGAKKTKNKITYIGSEYSLILGRLKDLEKLLTHYRDRENGSREYILFLYRYWQLCITESKDLSLQLTLQLNQRLSNSLTDKEVINATRSAEKYFDAGRNLRCSNAFIISALKITRDEMKGLGVFIGPEERKERKKKRNKDEYLARLQKIGKKTKDEQIKQRRKQVYKLLLKGKGANEICIRLNISRATFYADKGEIERYIDAKKQKEQERIKRYNAFRQTMQSRCLKISAFVLDMSFRTSIFVAPFCGNRSSMRSFYFRYLRFWGTSCLRMMSSPYFSWSGCTNVYSFLSPMP